MGPPVVTDEDGIRWITLNRPKIHNALLLDDLDVLVDAVRDAVGICKAIVITGAGRRSFGTGLHLDTFVDATPQTARTIISRVRECVGAVRLSPVPTVAMVNGYCLGAAFEIALACDLRVAHPGVQFGLPEVKLGIPSVVDAALLHHHVGLSKAKEIVLTGDLYPATELAAFGLVNRMVQQDLLRPQTEELVAKLGRLTPEVVAAQKSLFETWMNTGLQDGIDASVEAFARVFEHPVTLRTIAAYGTEARSK